MRPSPYPLPTHLPMGMGGYWVPMGMGTHCRTLIGIPYYSQYFFIFWGRIFAIFSNLKSMIMTHHTTDFCEKWVLLHQILKNSFLEYSPDSWNRFQITKIKKDSKNFIYEYSFYSSIIISKC
jgi:hypothetical protein